MSFFFPVLSCRVAMFPLLSTLVPIQLHNCCEICRFVAISCVVFKVAAIWSSVGKVECVRENHSMFSRYGCVDVGEICRPSHTFAKRSVKAVAVFSFIHPLWDAPKMCALPWESKSHISRCAITTSVAKLFHVIKPKVGFVKLAIFDSNFGKSAKDDISVWSGVCSSVLRVVKALRSGRLDSSASSRVWNSCSRLGAWAQWIFDASVSVCQSPTGVGWKPDGA